MTKEEKEIFLFEQACSIIAARLSNSSLKLNADGYLSRNLHPVYKELEKQFTVCCPSANKS
ncbi:hypothetical protein ABKU91_22830 [Enterobacter hormaechei]|uniref:hypothetical protein n=1 Tax=Enterobacter cloacae complex TaxID=354276 RepID=UPI0032B0AD70